ncbi:hypothetical protein [Streptomyces echinatus]|uniref:Uncharacterized protein n=1 Tax=Streptomyces echinatus TaxID=67293 RepID=A0A7W9PPU1_9ACTN|nr:hypothetical protein [Streptomyces echinatus]MBB5925153.1 hypothetical protein [Streptomyces echinatus]
MRGRQAAVPDGRPPTAPRPARESDEHPAPYRGSAGAGKRAAAEAAGGAWGGIRSARHPAEQGGGDEAARQAGARGPSPWAWSSSVLTLLMLLMVRARGVRARGG